jgi:PAS domain-containing protein
MTTTQLLPGTASLLRTEAENRLSQGTAPPSKGTNLSINTLRLLHELASSPASAADALKLLHELQVHQVELDLQLEQQQLNEHELTSDLIRYKTLFEWAPIAYLLLTLDGHIIQANLASATLLGTGFDELPDWRFDRFLTPSSRPAFAELLNKLNLPTFTGRINNLNPDSFSTSCLVQTGHATGGTGMLELRARVSPEKDTVLLIASRQH